jgi:exoribonuclease R
MPIPELRCDPTSELHAGFDDIRRELGIPERFPPEVIAEAEEAAARVGSVPAPTDLRDVPFVTIDPPGARDLDQALFISQTPQGHLVRYAIADVAAFVAPAGAVDAEASHRGVTVYLPDARTPLHPSVLGEGAASLLAGQERRALVWSIDLDDEGEVITARVERAVVRSRAQLAYDEVQGALDAGSADAPLTLLGTVGRQRQALERARGGVSLPLADQQVTLVDGRYELSYRGPVAVEGWNAQISLLTGMSAARLMLDAGIGVLRTLPPPSDDTLRRLRAHARALGVDWPTGAAYPDVIATLDVTRSGHAAFATQSARLFRGAGYLAFADGPPAAAVAVHGAVAAPYAHVTAPLRRLVDRFANEVVLAVCAGSTPPSWAADALPELPKLMGAARQREHRADAMATDLVEASVLAGHLGEEVHGVVVDHADEGSVVQLVEPAVVARVPESLELGADVALRVTGADVGTRTVAFALL